MPRELVSSRDVDPRRALDKDAWLRYQEQVRHERIVTVNEPMGLSPCLYFGTRRSTYSDVVSVVTTVKRTPRLSSSDSDSSATPLKLQLNGSSGSASSASTPGAPADSSVTITTTTPTTAYGSTVAWAERALRLSNDAMRAAEPAPSFVAASGAMDAPACYVGASPLDDSRDRTRRRQLQQANVALHAETQLFMTRLHETRRVRFEREHHAALVVQRMYRGFVLRQRFRALKTKLELRKRIRGTLVKVTRGTAIVTGEKDRRARVSAAQTAAAWRIQQQFRRWTARRVAAKARSVRRQELRSHCATCIQRTWRTSLARVSTCNARMHLMQQQQRALAVLVLRLFRGSKARQLVRRVHLQQRWLAAQRVQWAVQRHLADRVRRLQHRRQRQAQQHAAATLVQRIVRGHLSRTFVLVLRRTEALAIRAASALAIQRVYRGLVGRMRMRYERAFAIHERAWVCALHVTRLVRGFLARRAAALERELQETDVLVQTRRGNVSSVIDLLDGFGALNDEPADLAVVTVRSQNSIVHVAAQCGHVAILTHVVPKLLADNDANGSDSTLRRLLYARNRRGETPLALAIAHGHEHCAAYLLATTASLFDAHVHATAPVASASPEHATRRERSLLLLAARRGMGAIVAKLLLLFPHAFAGEVRDAWTQRSVLHDALMLLRPERLETTRETIEREDRVVQTLTTILTKLPQAPVDAQDIAGFTPLHLAAQLGSLRAVRLLLEYGADVTVADASGRTAWRIALLQSHDACFLELRRKWLDSVTSSSLSPSSSALVAQDSAQELVDRDDDRAGQEVFGSASAPAAPVRTRASSLRHPQLEQELVRACRASDLVRAQCLLDEFGVSINAVDSASDGAGDSALMLACRSRSVALVRCLIEHQDVRDNGGEVLDVHFVNRHGASAVQEALRASSPAILQLVLTACVRVDVCRPLGSTTAATSKRSMCHEAVRCGVALRSWLTQPAGVVAPHMLATLVDDDGHSLLHDAAAFGNIASAKTLVNVGARVDLASVSDRRSPLHDACRAGNDAIVRCLLLQLLLQPESRDGGDDNGQYEAVEMRDALGRSPFFDAVASGSIACVELLLAAATKAKAAVTMRPEQSTSTHSELLECDEATRSLQRQVDANGDGLLHEARRHCAGSTDDGDRSNSSSSNRSDRLAMVAYLTAKLSHSHSHSHSHSQHHHHDDQASECVASEDGTLVHHSRPPSVEDSANK